MWIRITLSVFAVTALLVLNHYATLQLGSVAAYSGLIAAAIGALCLVRPIRALYVPSRRAGLAVIAAGGLLTAAALAWPASTRTVAQHRMLLDDVLPQYDCIERHELLVRGSVDEVFGAAGAVTFAELPAFRVLMKLRAAASGRSWKGPQGPSPAVLEVMTNPRSGFVMLARNEREIVMGNAGRFWTAYSKPPITSSAAFAEFREPGCARMAFNLRAEDAGGGWTRLSTETRVLAVDAQARRAASAYWRIIYPGSGMVRQMWLEAARARAEKQ
ncbi:MAG: hypothetical protein ACM3ZB_08390 [bacterium]|jgi:hypothetical protein